MLFFYVLGVLMASMGCRSPIFYRKMIPKTPPKWSRGPVLGGPNESAMLGSSSRAPKRAPRRPMMAPRQPKTTPRQLQDCLRGPEHALETIQTVQDGSMAGPRRLKIVPRLPKKALLLVRARKCLPFYTFWPSSCQQEAPRCLQDCPRRPLAGS